MSKSELSITPITRDTDRVRQMIYTTDSVEELREIEEIVDSVSIGRGNGDTEKAHIQSKLLEDAHNQRICLSEDSTVQWRISEDEITTLIATPKPTFGSIYKNEWTEIYQEYSISDLQFIQTQLETTYTREAVVGSTEITESEVSDTIDAIRALRYAHGDQDITVTDIIPISNRGSGPSKELIETQVEFLFEMIHPVFIIGTALHLDTITRNTTYNKHNQTYQERRDASGWYLFDQKAINIKDGYPLPDELTTSNRWVRFSENPMEYYVRGTVTVFHEFGHFFHTLLGVRFPTVDFRDAPPEDWFWNTLGDAHGEGSFVGVKPINLSYISRYKQIWTEWMRVRPETVVREYAKKGPAEFFAVGFEAWVANPAYLNDKHPELLSYFKDIFLKQ